jgi:hypothetical protein
MNASLTSTNDLNRRLWNWATTGWIAEVPEEIACCEFDCPRVCCEQGRWKSCEHRLHHAAILANRPTPVRDTMQLASAT